MIILAECASWLTPGRQPPAVEHYKSDARSEVGLTTIASFCETVMAMKKVALRGSESDRLMLSLSASIYISKKS
ncbi:jg5199 [Pararge aegeria aegeria]|uniref:Jg5199 protein n=1 Tax=Pararge aegeria aegeria TaxID=348720 RepID=A0A8S4S1W7_9NEOP|nr:jg5199 [Pararge aegeria aegeria]